MGILITVMIIVIGFVLLFGAGAIKAASDDDENRGNDNRAFVLEPEALVDFSEAIRKWDDFKLKMYYEIAEGYDDDEGMLLVLNELKHRHNAA
ncbi:hypothetical protein EQG49_06445 [Periweissella cryptocerci]|uniref:Uncharacterized protein n=2 Tax=Periweissella cryptocerci TaxID=2506420 RepID=A0A4P6YTU5_9LACO|nr:hypothetical protein EQG49_06445 [Periweissella cryptocerci]